MLTFIITSCDNKEELSPKSQTLNNPMQLYIINGDIEYYSEITDGSKPKKPIFVYDIPDKANKTNNLTSKTSEQSATINFNSGIGSSTKSGCTVKRYNNGNSYYTDAGVFGSIPYTYPYPETTSYLVRGYGAAHLNPSYGSLVLFVGNKGVKLKTTRGIIHNNQPNGSAISIEFPFKANITYEISLKVDFRDLRYLIDNTYSIGYPTLFAQLKDDGIIPARSYLTQTQDPCDKEGVIGLQESSNDYQNYTRSYTLDSRAVIERNITFRYSPTKEKKALLISLHPSLSVSGYEAPIQTNDYIMRLPLVTITEKPFDPSLNIETPINSDSGNINGGGGRR